MKKLFYFAILAALLAIFSHDGTTQTTPVAVSSFCFVTEQRDEFTSTANQKTFTATNSPNALKVYLNGTLQRYGVDYTLSSQVVTFVKAQPVGEYVTFIYYR